jgi:hypothetical protein
MTTHLGRGPTRALVVILGMLAQAALAQAPPGETGPTQSQSPLSASPPATPATSLAPSQPTSQAPSQIPTSAATSAVSADPGTWHTVTGPEKSFMADLPAPPTYTTTEVKTGTGSLYTVHQYLLEQGDVAYIVQMATYPEDINVSNPRTNLQGGLDNLAKSMEGAKWTSVDWVSHQGLTASDAVGTRSGHAIRSFSVMKGRQVFTLIYAGEPGTARSADVNRFVASLRVNP